MEQKEFNRLLEKAKNRVKSMDQIDGFAQIDLGLDIALQTIQSAIQAGVMAKDITSILDAYVMIQQIRDRLE